MKSAILVTMTALLLVGTNVLAIQPTNARLGGFGGVGVAVRPEGGRTALRINPAAAGLIEDRVHLHLGGAGGSIELEGNGDLGTGALGLEVMGPVGRMTLIGSVAGEAWAEDEDAVWTASVGTIGLAAALARGYFCIGGELGSWRSTYRWDPDGAGELEYDLGPELIARNGLLIRLGPLVNLGLVHQSEVKDRDVDDGIEYSAGQPTVLRTGLVVQPPRRSFLIGGELVWSRELELSYGRILPERAEAHFFGEVELGRWVALRGGLAVLEEDHREGSEASLGGSVRLGRSVVLDLFTGARSWKADDPADDSEESYGGLGLTVMI